MAKKKEVSFESIEKKLHTLRDNPVPASEVGYVILQAFGKGDAEIQRYREGKGIVAKFDGILIKGFFCYREAFKTELTDTLEALKTHPLIIKNQPKIIVVSDGETCLGYDTRERDTYENPVANLAFDFEFFEPLRGIERVKPTEEAAADVKAAYKLAKLHSEICAYNDLTSNANLHDLNIFIARLLFCFFAEDTGIFEDNLFSDFIKRNTLTDGSDLSQMIDRAFIVMDQKDNDRTETSAAVLRFPYVNGGLFSKHINIPQLSYKAREIIIECSKLHWDEINPDIFGSMIQAVVDPAMRSQNGMHYTSVPNIMKVIQPLFLDELRSEYNRLNDTYLMHKQKYDLGGFRDDSQYITTIAPIAKECAKLQKRISAMKFFDPACGSGNFLIITYKALRLLDMDLLRLSAKCTSGIPFVEASTVSLSQFYGIEINDFPHEVAMLSLWLAEHQMNTKHRKEFGTNIQALPLRTINQIHCGNACRMDWNAVCPHTPDEEVFIFGNPPYLGSKLQDASQKSDIDHVFGNLKDHKILDYISIWFYLGAQYIANSNAKYAFVTTNSICQGEQVAVLWPLILNSGLNIDFAYTSFKWANNAKHNAGVTVAIVGISQNNKKTKTIYTNDRGINTDFINPYLSSGSSTIVAKNTKNPVGYPKMCFGCMPYDNGHLIMDAWEHQKFVEDYPQDIKYIKQLIGAEEYINGKERYCLWIDDSDVEIAKQNEVLSQRIEATKNFRLNEAKDAGAKKLAEKPYQFREHPDIAYKKIIIPCHSSENRDYIPIGLLGDDTVVSNSALAIYDAPTHLFGLLTSRMHMTWVRTVGGRLKTDYRYSAQLCYNTFPFPKLTEEKRKAIEDAANKILETREYDLALGSTLADLYDPDTMPDALRQAHAELDDIVENCYPGYPFASDEARLECLFKMYEKMTKKK